MARDPISTVIRKVVTGYGLLTLVLLALSVAAVSAQSGGVFEMTKSVIAGGGGTSAGDIFLLTGTVADPLGGNYSTGGPFELSAGFWSLNSAPQVTISGHVLTPANAGVRNAVVVLTDSLGLSRAVRTGAGGSFSFDGVEPGRVYTISVRSKRYRFSSQTIEPSASINDLNFIGTLRRAID